MIFNKPENFPDSRISDKPSQIYFLKRREASFHIHEGSILYRKFLKSDKKGILIYTPGLQMT